MEKYLIPTLVKLDCQRTAMDDGTLPYEQMKLDKLHYGKLVLARGIWKSNVINDNIELHVIV